LIFPVILLALVHLAFLQSGGPVAWEIAMSLIYGPPAECNTPLHAWLYYTQAEKSEHPCAQQPGWGNSICICYPLCLKN
jgi:hypothetical protein